MGKDLKDEFFSVMMRVKKMGAVMSSECDMQMNELAILKSAAIECGDCYSMNLNVPQLQEQLHITKPAISYILNSLEKKSYIIRTIDSRDRRKISISVTPKGKEVAEQSIQQYDNIWLQLVEKFGEENMSTLIRLLNQLTGICEAFPDETKA